MENLILNSLEIRRFRAFRHLHVERLSRVNLIVGKNNVGVVSLLAVGGKIGENLAEERGSFLAMEEKQLATIGSFWLNEACEEYQQVNHGNIMKEGKTESGVQHYRCKTCKKTFTQTKGTMVYRCRHSAEEIVECMQLLGDRTSLAAIHRIKGIKAETVGHWLEKAAPHVEQFEEGIVRKQKLSRVQTDALWTSVGHKGKKGQARARSKRTILAWKRH